MILDILCQHLRPDLSKQRILPDHDNTSECQVNKVLGLALCVVPSSVAGWYTNLFLIPLLG